MNSVRPTMLAIVAAVCAVSGATIALRHLHESAGQRGFPASPMPAMADAAGLPAVSIGGPFALRAADGHLVHADSFGRRWLLVYFGYTSCPDVCPTMLQTVAGALRRLGPYASRIAPLFITVDPERDTPQLLARYTALFDPRIIGLGGTPAQIAAAEGAYRVYAAPAPASSGSYTVDHTSFLYLMDPAGHLRALFDRQVTVATLASGIERQIGSP